jgi:Zn finger protein HypA/HybF involved in hydrogenase expression
MTITLAVRHEDIRRIGIACRCGMKSVAEIPEQICHALHIHLCPSCKSMFGIQKQGDKWKIGRINMDVPGNVVMRAEEKEEEEPKDKEEKFVN